MDHLPAPIDGERLYVPFYAEARIYKPNDFFTLPGEEQYDYKDTSELIERGLNPGWRSEKANAFLQSWLFFALLSQVLGVEIDAVKDFRSTDYANNPQLNTTRLNEFLGPWAEREKEVAATQDSNDRMTRYIRATLALNEARKFVSKHCSYQNFDPAEDSDEQDVAEDSIHLDTKMTLSLAILGETLQREQPQMDSHLEGRLQFWTKPDNQQKTWGNSKYLRDTMLKAKWCPREIRRLELALQDVSIVYYASSMKSKIDDADHSSCTFWRCQAEVPNTPMHFDNCDRRCALVPLDEGKLEEVVKENKTALVTYSTTGKLEIMAVDFKGGKIPEKFGALSHAWADGIVHDADNRRGVPKCQLNFLQQKFNEILHREGRPNIPFWVDELCLPLQDSLRGVAINQIIDIYSKAHAVLVWDAGLLRTPIGRDSVEANVRITTGQWASRLWTLQEGVLAGTLHFQFQDGLITTPELEERRDAAKQDLLDSHHHIWRAAHPFSRAMRSLRKRETEFQVQHVWKAVQFRKAALCSDETICLANILGIDVRDILSIRSAEDDKTLAEKRMVKLIDLLD